MKSLSNSDVAQQAGVHPMLLERWLVTGKLAWPRFRIERGRIVRLWDESDIERIRRCKARTSAKTRRR